MLVPGLSLFPGTCRLRNCTPKHLAYLRSANLHLLNYSFASARYIVRQNGPFFAYNWME
jgi:hypothetical protein